MKTLPRRAPQIRVESYDFTEKEKEVMAEVELRKLQQHFRILVENRKSFALKMQRQLYLQEKQIHDLKEEYDEINLLISLTKSPQNIFMDEHSFMELRFLLQTRDEYDALIRATKGLIAELDNKIDDLQKKIATQRGLVIKLRREYEGKWLHKQIQLLDKRLYHATVRFNTVLTTNAKLREEIRSLLCVKNIFGGIYSRLHRTLKHQNKVMDTSIEQSTQAYEQRVEALARISALKERRCKDIAQFNIEFRELERIYNHEMKLKAFMLIKLVDRSEYEEQAKKEEVLKAKKRAKKTKGESFESYEVAYMRLLKMTENGDIKQLVDEFVAKEEKNFGYFSYVTELNNDMERLQKRIEDIQNEISQLKSHHQVADDKVYSHLKEMEEKMQKATEDTIQYEQKLKKSNKILDQLKMAVDFLFKEIDCDGTKIRQHLGETEEITNQNLMQYFSILEKKSNDLLLIESFLRYKELEGELDSVPMLNPFMGGSSMLRRIGTVKVVPPSLTVDPFSDASDSVEGPLDHENLRDMILENQDKSYQDKSRSSVTEKSEGGKDKRKSLA